MEKIFDDWVKLDENSVGKRFASIIKNNDGKKNIYLVKLEITGITPEEVYHELRFTKRKSIDLVEEFLNIEAENFYWSQSISEFINHYYN